MRVVADDFGTMFALGIHYIEHVEWGMIILHWLALSRCMLEIRIPRQETHFWRGKGKRNESGRILGYSTPRVVSDSRKVLQLFKWTHAQGPGRKLTESRECREYETLSMFVLASG